MGMRRRFSYLCLAFVEDTLADLEGVLDEIKLQSGASWPGNGSGGSGVVATGCGPSCGGIPYRLTPGRGVHRAA